MGTFCEQKFVHCFCMFTNSLYLERNAFSLYHGLSTTCKSSALTPDLHKSRPGRLLLFFVLLLLLAILSVRDCSEIRITNITVYSLRVRSIVMCISLMAMFWLEKLVDTWLAEDVAAWYS